MDTIVTAREANRSFSKLLRQVKAGERVLITSNGRPAARMVGVDVAPDPAREARKNALVATLRKRAATPLQPWSRDELYD